ncbi:MAG: MerR family transcriptional regulator [Actinomycetota bacterium]
MSIGEVLKTLSSEFPDISISKIRFLETEGLIETERTTSGYRKFFPDDIARLRYILRLQRDQFVPLKVIRKRMEHFDPAETAVDEQRPVPGPTGANKPEQNKPGADKSEVEAVAVPIPNTVPSTADDDFTRFDTGLSLSFEELRNSAGVEPEHLRELEEFGLIHAHVLPSGGTCYDEDDLVVAKLSKDFSKYGIHARHLKMYKVFAAKEAGLFEQVISPQSGSTGSNGGERQKQAVQSLAELARLSKRLKHLLLKADLREHLHS